MLRSFWGDSTILFFTVGLLEALLISDRYDVKTDEHAIYAKFYDVETDEHAVYTKFHAC